TMASDITAAARTFIRVSLSARGDRQPSVSPMNDQRDFVRGTRTVNPAPSFPEIRTEALRSRDCSGRRMENAYCRGYLCRANAQQRHHPLGGSRRPPLAL